MSGFLERQTFSTSTIDPSRTMQAWRTSVEEFYFKVDIRAPTTPIAGRLKKRIFADVAASSWQSSAHKMSRDKRLVRDDKAEIYCLCVVKRGAIGYSQRGRDNEASPGEVFVVNAAEPFEADIADQSKALCLAVPCDLMRLRVRGIDDMCGQRRFADPALSSTLLHLITSALDVAPSVDAGRLQELCLNMVDLMILGDRHDGLRYSEMVATCVVEKARHVIRDRLADPSFNVTAAACACGVSTRQLQHALTTEGSTFGRELMEARLQASARILTSRDVRPRQIGDIAAACGFQSQSHFATRYKERFGISPRMARLSR